MVQLLLLRPPMSYTTISTIATTVVSGTVTVPTTLFSTAVVTRVGPATSGRETYTKSYSKDYDECILGNSVRGCPWDHATQWTSDWNYRESYCRCTRWKWVLLLQQHRALSGSLVTSATPGEHITVEFATSANRRVETSIVTRREGNTATATTPVTDSRSNITYYT